ncbi:hypothetical protein E3N88_03820 [Mikania micrantha]|uniref:Uncharacterized protein n=1 Tax=Mikania micrantha TaxID=192012 RepID=A0A5N6PT74_9ASTR|nr:hypothetical protein E3N88_03820 [Mikania micrantha]
MFTRHDKNYGRGRRFENREQGRSKSSQDNWRDDKIRREKEKKLLHMIALENKERRKMFHKILTKEVCVVSPRCKPIKIQEVGVTQVKEGGKQVKNDDTREGFKVNEECARVKDKVMEIKEDDIYHKGRKPKFSDNGG